MIPIAAFLSGVLAFYAFRFFPYLTALASLVSLSFLIYKRRFSPSAALAFGVLYAFLRFTPQAPANFFEPANIEGCFSSPAVRIEKNFIQGFRAASGEALDVYSGREFPIGEHYVIKADISPPSVRLNPGAWKRDRPRAFLIEAEKSGGKPERAYFGRMRERLEKFLIGNIEPESAAFLMSVTTGQRANLSMGMREAFNRSGLAHLLSISGTHFALFSIALFGIFKSLLKRLPLRPLELLTSRMTPSQTAALLTAPFMLFYLGLSGGGIPTVRSFIMINLFLLGLIIERKGGWLNFLLFAAFLIVLHDPEAMFNLSFQLSFLAVFSIGAAREIFKRPDDEDEMADSGKNMTNIVENFLKKPVLVALAATVGTAPLVAYHFKYLSLISPVSNLVVTPIVGFLLVPFSLLGSFSYLLTGHFLFAAPLQCLTRLALFLIEAFAAIPLSSLKAPLMPPVIAIVSYAGLVFCLLAVFRYHSRRYILILPFIPLLLYFSYSYFKERPLGITLLDAGHADASVVELPDGKVMVVDTGRSGREVADYLGYIGADKIDALVLTHPHPDHVGGAAYLIGRFKVVELWDNGLTRYPAGLINGIAHRPLSRGGVAAGDGYKIYVLHPYPGFYTEENDWGVEVNNDSLVLKIEGKGKSILLTGDIEQEAEEDMLNLGGLLKCDAIKVPHHGGRGSAHEGFFRAVSPETAVVTGKTLRNKEMAGILKGKTVLFTGQDGAVRIGFESPQEKNGGKLSVKTFREFKLKETGDIREELKNIAKLFRTWT